MTGAPTSRLGTRRLRERGRASAAALALLMGLGPVALVTQLMGATPAAAATPSVKDISGNALTSGTLFGGRPQNLTVDPANASIVLASGEFGGLWKSTNAGGSWAHVDSLPLTAMDDVQYATSDANLVVATGQYDGVSSTVNGEIYVSTDGGTTWTRANTATCGGSRSAHHIAISTGAVGHLTVFVGTDCGLVKSTDSGTTWTDITPSGFSTQFNDVKVRGTAPNFTVDTCGGSGFFRSTNGGTIWTRNAGAFLGGGAGNCRIATAPGNANVVLVSSASTIVAPIGLNEGQLLESDNGGATFTNLNASNDGNGRATTVITHAGFDGLANHFEVFFGDDTRMLHQTCDTNNLTKAVPTTACVVGNGANGGSFSVYDNSIAAVHNGPDVSDLAFGTNGCPFLESGDGGVFKTANGCAASPTFTQANVGLHALQVTGEAGSSYAGHTDLYFTTQDNGIWNTGDGGTTWKAGGPDAYGVFADQNGPPSQVLYKECCFSTAGGPIFAKLFTNNEAMTAQANLTAPPGILPAFGNILGAQFGNQRYALITPATVAGVTTWRVYVTTNNGTAWTEMGADLPAGSNPTQIVASGPSATPTFYILDQSAGTVTKLSGALNGTAVSTNVSGTLLAPGLIAVNPTNPLLLYARDDSAGAMMKSTNGGGTWTQDTALTNLVTANGTYAITGVTAIALDGASNKVLVGTVDEGVFASGDKGVTWALLNGSVAIQRSVGFFFDAKTGKAYAGSNGRGEWEIDFPVAVPTSLTLDGPLQVVNGTSATMTGTLKDNLGQPVVGRTVNFTLGSGVNVQTCSGVTNAAGVATCTITTVAQPATATSLAAGDSFAGDIYYLPSSKSATIKLLYYTGRDYALAIGLLGVAPNTFVDTGAVSTSLASNTQVVGAAVTIPLVLSAGAPVVTAVTGSGTSTGTATTSTVTIGLPLLPVLQANSVTSSSTSTCTAATGTSTFSSFSIGGFSVAVGTAPNQTITLGTMTITFNEQLPIAGADKGLIVNALHVTVPGLYDIVIAHAESDIHGCP